MESYDRNAELGFDAEVVGGGGVPISKVIGTHYRIVCVDPDGSIKWVEEFDNLVVVSGLNYDIEQLFKGSGYTADWYVGLTTGSPTFAEGDTMVAHAGWSEIDWYSQANRPAFTPGTVVTGSVDNIGNVAAFSITGGVTVGGAFLVNHDEKLGNTGTLYGGGAFTSGDRAVLAGDTLNVTVTVSATPA